MADEREVRRALHGRDDEALPPIDVESVVRRSRGRRRARRIAVGAGAALSAAAVVTALVVNIPHSATVMSEAGSGAADGEVPNSAEESTDSFSTTDLAPAYKVNGCEGAIATSVTADGLSIDVEFPRDAPIGAPVAGTVVLTNTGGAPVAGIAAPPATTLGQEGTVRWHSDAPVGPAVDVALEPGASIRLDAEVVPVACTAADEAAASSPDDLPPLPPGDYTVSGALDMTLSDGRIVQLVSAPEAVTLR